MIEDIIDQTLEKTLERTAVLCSDETKMERLYDTVFTPLMKYISMKITWFVRAIECLALLIIIQTVLLVIIIQRL